MHIHSNIDTESVVRLNLLRRLILHSPDDIELVHCLDIKTGDECDVVFVPALDEDGVVYLIPGFPVPVDNSDELINRYVPVSQLAKSNPTKFYNN